MTPTAHLHYAMGQIAYAMSGIDGKVQREERKKFHDIVAAEVRCHHYDFDVSDIIYQVLDKDKTDVQTAYEWGMNELRINSHYLDPELKQTFIRIAEKIAKAFPPVNAAEQVLLDRFTVDIAPLKGDPVYYQ